MIIEANKNMNRSSWSVWLASGGIILAFLLYYFPDWAKIFLFLLPTLLLFGEGIEFLFKYYKRRKALTDLIGGIFFSACGTLLLFCGRKTFMVGIAVLMLFETFYLFRRIRNGEFFEKIMIACAALLSFIWMILIFFKGLNLFWSVREYLALYFLCVSVITLLYRK